MIASLRIAGAAGACAALAAPLAAQKNAPATYAITNAKIVPVSGPAIDKGTLVIRDGIIAAVGANVAVPADARTIDGTGLTVYPGLIDGYSSLGYATANATAAAGAAAATAGRGGRGAAATPTATRAEGAPNSNYGVGMQPEVQAVDQLEPDETSFDAAHAAGFTTALTANASGIFRGTSALIDLDGTDVSALVVKSPVTQNIDFARGGAGGRGGGGGGGGFPGSLMGVFAQLRQELLDAGHYRDLKAAYAANPRSMARPDYDPSLEALQPVLAGTVQVVMFANTEREIIRALDLAKEFHLKAVIAGGSEAYKVADRLKAANVPVLLTLNFPRAGAAGGGGGFGGGGGRGGGGDPSDPEPLRMLRDRVMAPRGPEMLAQAGVKFIFQSGANYTETLANLRKAVTAGLPADVALRALTTSSADFFGVSDRLGSLEVGKIANLTITRGDLLDPAGRVTSMFVDGRPVTIAAAAGTNGTGGRGGRGGNPGADVSGAWQVTVSLGGADHTVTVHLTQDEGRLYGAVQGALGAMEIVDGGIDDDGSFYFTVMLSRNGSTDEAEFDGTMENGSMRGKLSVEDHAGGTFSGGRAQ